MVDSKFIGNKKTVEYLDRVIQKDDLAHAYIFDGPEHVGKTKMALEFAGKILEDSSPNIKNNPDLIFVGSGEKDKILAESIRIMQKDLSLYPYRAKKKVAVIENAHLMNKTASNSLLKTLEEPSETSILILVSSNSDKIIDTIKSRCQTVKFSLVEEGTIEKEMLGGHKEAKKILELSGQRPGLAIKFLEDSDFLNEVWGFLDNISNLKEDNFSRIKEAEKLSILNRDVIYLVLDCLGIYFRKEMNRGLEADSLVNVENNLKNIESINNIKNSIKDSNVNLKLAIENLYLNLN